MSQIVDDNIELYLVEIYYNSLETNDETIFTYIFNKTLTIVWLHSVFFGRLQANDNARLYCNPKD